MPLVPINTELNALGVVTISLLIEGEDVTTQCNLISASIFNGVNRLATADLVLQDGNAAMQDFELSNEETFVPGRKLVLQVGYNSSEEKIFEGIIVSQKISMHGQSTQLHLQAKSAAYPMTLGRKSNIFYESSDSDVIEEIVGTYNLQADVASMSVVQSELVQYRATDWDFMVSRAQINGCICYQNDDTFKIEKPDLTKEPVQVVTMGDNLFSMQLEMDARNQYKEYQSKTWNFSDQEITASDAEGAAIDTAGDFGLSDLASKNTNANMELVHGGSISSDAATNWIDAKKQWQEMSKITGTISVQGQATYKPGEIIELRGVGNRFSGKHFASAINHTIELGNWITSVNLGINPEWFAEQFTNVSDLPAAAMLPSINGLHIGVVTALEGDPEGEHRIQIKLPMVHAASDGVWARVLSGYAGEGIGIQFLPEIGTEVLIGFLNDDPNQAVVLGGLFSNKHTAPNVFTDDNFIKTIKTKSNIKIEIDDDKVAIKIETPGGNIIKADDDASAISLEDSHGNKIVMDDSGIAIESASDIVLNAIGDIKISGSNIKQEANANFEASGSAGIDLSSSGTAILKGSLVQIN